MPVVFPAVVIGGAPHCGKSVLTYLLSRALKQERIEHYVLRAAPDGEGNWFLDGGAGDVVRRIRQQHKTAFSPAFVAHVTRAVRERWLPLLVDVGGKPQGEQLNILHAATHVILLYRSAAQLQAWRALISQTGLQTVAELRSVRGQGAITRLHPILQGTIGGLDRQHPRQDATFGALLERLSAILAYPPERLRAHHFRRAPYPVLDIRDLAAALGVEATHWPPTALPAVIAYLQRQPGPRALYGPAPAWLVAAIVAALTPHPCAAFDPRYGWLTLPDLPTRPNDWIRWTVQPTPQAWLASAHLPRHLIEPDTLTAPALPADRRGVILDGKLPLWAFAALTRALAPGRAFLAVHDARRRQAVVVTADESAPSPGACLPMPLPKG